MDRNSPIRQCELEFIALHRVLNPSISRAQLTTLVEKQFGIRMTYKQCTKSLERSEPIVKKMSSDDGYCLRVAKATGVIKLGHKILRIQSLEKILEAAMQNGHEAAAVAAVKLIKEELTAEVVAPNTQVIISSHSPPQEDIPIEPEEYEQL
ncbi:hypothetical protein CLI64_11105 [Nostoc sp. CENA543]|uniref:hypothetical protein n=1 Tax=Nostoc sp. CENA543 TaxID=1869241 RepID=UPI000CA2485B|nr:hypothetical protein [Nostoc sp. CENA543]AUT00902.1 hypothetical protein CLI64_11105 [Nostoc sp. CENA543]